MNEDIPFGQAVLLDYSMCWQWTYVPPFIIATAVAMSSSDAGLIDLLGAGIASLIQVLFFLKLPVCQGPSFVPVERSSVFILVPTVWTRC